MGYNDNKKSDVIASIPKNAITIDHFFNCFIVFEASASLSSLTTDKGTPGFSLTYSALTTSVDASAWLIILTLLSCNVSAGRKKKSSDANTIMPNISKILSITTVANDAVTLTFSFFATMTGLIISPILAGNTQFAIKPIIVAENRFNTETFFMGAIKADHLTALR